MLNGTNSVAITNTARLVLRSFHRESVYKPAAKIAALPPRKISDGKTVRVSVFQRLTTSPIEQTTIRIPATSSPQRMLCSAKNDWTTSAVDLPAEVSRLDAAD
jgi:hypothetical protein